jgi:hypothetical protein
MIKIPEGIPGSFISCHVFMDLQGGGSPLYQIFFTRKKGPAEPDL